MRIPRGITYLLVASFVLSANTPSFGAGASRPRSRSASTQGWPVVEPVECPTARGLGVASRPGPAVAVARRFLQAERGRTDQGMAATADRWLRHRLAPGGAAGFNLAFPPIPPTDDAWVFRLRPPRWLDARFGPIGPFTNARMKLLAAGVQAYSCPRRLIHRLVSAMWWIQVVLPRCDCDPDRVLDLLVVRRRGTYRVFGLG